ncbi:MAG: ABC transporter ATP-binding protein [Bacteroidales bacterium]|jgi:ABC-2 type transport system ATP-binding protein|nr:ABC transporter ATP-binding protein [Bacteroidales bacterium]
MQDNLVYNIVAERLKRKFGDFIAVDDISFEVAKGEIFGFLGANGAGKTTTIRMLCGLLMPTAGTAKVCGYDILTQGKEIRKHIGYMSQKFSLYEDLTITENMELFGTIYRLDRQLLRKRILNIIARLDIRYYANKKVVSLPLGLKQKLSFATAILHQPEVVFLDEPTSGADPLVRREFWNMIYEAARNGITVLVTTHYMDEAEYCNRICIMNQGQIKIIGNPSELKEQHNVLNMNDLFQKIVNLTN